MANGSLILKINMDSPQLSLEQMMTKEGKRNTYLKKLMERTAPLTELPPTEVLTELGGKEAYLLCANKLEFDYRLRLDVLLSNQRLIGLMEAYIADAEAMRREDAPIISLRCTLEQFQADSAERRESFVREVMGYGTSG